MNWTALATILLAIAVSVVWWTLWLTLWDAFVVPRLERRRTTARQKRMREDLEAQKEKDS